MKRASSPPEATFIIGPGLRAGIGLHPELGAVDAVRAGHRWLRASVENFARSSLSGSSSALTALSSFSAAFLRFADSAFAAAS